jgi:lipopolysaccharide transport system ATP-binding protein
MSEISVKLEDASKFYKLYNSPKDRLKEALHPFGRKLHREFYALKHINLEVKKGEILGIVGRNGSGKSTLLKLISMVIQPSTGKVVVNGAVSAMLELGSGLHPDFTGMQNIYFSGTMMGFSRKEMNKKIDSIVNFAEIGDFIHQPLKTYSSGMKARLGFALAVNMEPKILILDEVLSVGDELFKRKCFAKMEEFFKTKCTVFFVSHSIAHVNEICTKAILLDRGELILEGSTKFVTMNYQKFLFSKAEEAQAAREEIIRLNRDENRKKMFVSAPGNDENDPDSSEEKADQKRNSKNTPRLKAYYMPDFKPKSTVVTKNFNVDIFDIHIRDMDGEKVNALVMHEDYIYSYKIKFGITVENINFGMGFKSEKGTALSWMIHPGINQYISEKFYEDDSYCVEWQFKCLFIPGNYFIDSGIRMLTNETQMVLAKITDATVFKVLDDDCPQKGGFFDSIQNVEINKLQESPRG